VAPPAPGLRPIEVRVSADGRAAVGGQPVVAGAEENLQDAVLNYLHRLVLATGHPVVATVHDERIGYSTPIQVEADGSSAFAGRPVPLAAPAGAVPFGPVAAPGVPAANGVSASSGAAPVMSGAREASVPHGVTGGPVAGGASEELPHRAAAEGPRGPEAFEAAPAAKGPEVVESPDTLRFAAVPAPPAKDRTTRSLRKVPEAALHEIRPAADPERVQDIPTAVLPVQAHEVPPAAAEVASVQQLPAGEPVEVRALPAPEPARLQELPAAPQPAPAAEAPVAEEPVVVQQASAPSRPAGAQDAPAAPQPARVAEVPAAVQPAGGAEGPVALPVTHGQEVPAAAQATQGHEAPAAAQTVHAPQTVPAGQFGPAASMGAATPARASAPAGTPAPVGRSAVPGVLAEPVGRINEAVRMGRLEFAASMAEQTIGSAARTLGVEHPEVLQLRELAAYIAYLAGDAHRSFALNMGLARVHRRQDPARALGNVQSAAAAWLGVRDPELGLSLGAELVALWTEMAAEGGPAAADPARLEAVRARMDRLAARAGAAPGGHAQSGGTHA
jgi:hypothetical protein